MTTTAAGRDIRDLRVSVPEGISGEWRVERFTVSKKEADFQNLRASIGTSSRPISAGDYTRLTYRHSVVMSDTPVEQHDHAVDADRYISIMTYNSTERRAPSVPEEIKREDQFQRLERLKKKKSSPGSERFS